MKCSQFKFVSLNLIFGVLTCFNFHVSIRVVYARVTSMCYWAAKLTRLLSSLLLGLRLQFYKNLMSISKLDKILFSVVFSMSLFEVEKHLF